MEEGEKSATADTNEPESTQNEENIDQTQAAAEPSEGAEDGQPAAAGEQPDGDQAGAEQPEGGESPEKFAATEEDIEFIKEEVIKLIGGVIPEEAAMEPTGSDIVITSEEEEEEEEGEMEEEVEEEEEEEAKEEQEEEEKEEPFVREVFVERYRALQQDKAKQKRKSAVLNKKLVEYYKKRRMESAYKELESLDEDVEQKYNRKLYIFNDLKLKFEKETSEANTELNSMRMERNRIKEDYNCGLQALLDRERQIGSGLISLKTGKPIPEKVLDRLLRRQCNNIYGLSDIRLTFIKLRDHLAAKDAALRALETLGEGLYLIDYEQLHTENQSYCDKIEERDEELAVLRTKATSSIQILAHVREKEHATVADIEDITSQLEQTDMEVTAMREHIAKERCHRDRLRQKTIQARKDAGLLALPHLLKDLETSIEQCAHLSAQLQNLKNTYSDQKQSLVFVRKTIKELTRKSQQGPDSSKQGEKLKRSSSDLKRNSSHSEELSSNGYKSHKSKSTILSG